MNLSSFWKRSSESKIRICQPCGGLLDKKCVECKKSICSKCMLDMLKKDTHCQSCYFNIPMNQNTMGKRQPWKETIKSWMAFFFREKSIWDEKEARKTIFNYLNSLELINISQTNKQINKHSQPFLLQRRYSDISWFLKIDLDVPDSDGRLTVLKENIAKLQRDYDILRNKNELPPFLYGVETPQYKAGMVVDHYLTLYNDERAASRIPSFFSNCKHDIENISENWKPTTEQLSNVRKFKVTEWPNRVKFMSSEYSGYNGMSTHCRKIELKFESNSLNGYNGVYTLHPVYMSVDKKNCHRYREIKVDFYINKNDLKLSKTNTYRVCTRVYIQLNDNNKKPDDHIIFYFVHIDSTVSTHHKMSSFKSMVDSRESHEQMPQTAAFWCEKRRELLPNKDMFIEKIDKKETNEKKEKRETNEKTDESSGSHQSRDVPEYSNEDEQGISDASKPLTPVEFFC